MDGDPGQNIKREEPPLDPFVRLRPERGGSEEPVREARGRAAGGGEPTPGVRAPEGSRSRDALAARWLRDMPFWALSALLHLMCFVLLLNLVQEEKEVEGPDGHVSVRLLSPPPQKYDPTLRRDVKRTPKILDHRKIKDPIIRRKPDDLTLDIPRGTSLDNLTNLELGQTSIHDAIGVLGGASGAYGERWGKGSLVREGGSEGSEDAVRAALEWLVRHQSPDGRWEAQGFTRRCTRACSNSRPGKHGDGRGGPDFDVGVTGLALLAFAGYGHTHRTGIHPEYVDAVSKAVRYLKGIQVFSENPDENGRFGPGAHRKWIYDHALATMAMAELYVMSRDVIGLKRSVQSAVELCLEAQNPGRGWRYGVRPGDSDVSVTGWMVLALKAAKNAGVGATRESFDASFRSALDYFRSVTGPDGRTGYVSRGGDDNRAGGWPQPYPFSREHSCMTAVSVLCRLFAGEKRSDPLLRSGVGILLEELPRWQEREGKKLSTINLYYWYYASYALFQYGGEPWTIWNQAMRKTLLSSQRRGGCEDGSWDTAGEWSAQGGRVYTTALGAMTLEVYYRFRRLEEGISF